MRRLCFVLLLVACKASDAPADNAGTSDENEVKVCGAITGPSNPDDATRMWALVPRAWRTYMESERRKDYFYRLATFVAEARRRPAPVYPSEAETFTALTLAADPDAVQVVILGQDPYIQAGQAHGLAFSVKPKAVPPPSLKNIFKELQSDIPSIQPVSHGSLVAWAKQGVLLLNAILTVEDEKSGSHACHGWETFSDAIITTLSERRDRLVFVLWGAFAQSKSKLIDPRHVIITGSHPSPLSVNDGFYGTRPFSRVNEALRAQRKRAIDWQLPADPGM